MTEDVQPANDQTADPLTALRPGAGFAALDLGVQDALMMKRGELRRIHTYFAGLPLTQEFDMRVREAILLALSEAVNAIGNPRGPQAEEHLIRLGIADAYAQVPANPAKDSGYADRVIRRTRHYLGSLNLIERIARGFTDRLKSIL